MHGLGVKPLFNILVPTRERKGGIMVVGSLGPISYKDFPMFGLILNKFIA